MANAFDSNRAWICLFYAPKTPSNTDSAELQDREAVLHNIMRRAGTLFLAAGMAVALTGGLAACGKKARLKPPENSTYEYPRTYPKGAPKKEGD